MYRVYVGFVAIIFVVLSCNSRETKSRFKHGELYVLADTNKLGLIQGEALFYNIKDDLVKRANFSGGVRNGPSVSYFEEGSKKDSVAYANGKEVGYWYFYDSTGKLKSREYYYYGKQLGPIELYDRYGVIRNYYFTDFEKHDNVFATYDYQGKLTQIEFFDMQFLAKKVDSYGQQMVSIFSYLPRPPYCNVEYQIGITKDGDRIQQLFEVKNSVFIDTLLPVLDSNWSYNISGHVKQTDGSFNRVYFEEYGRTNLKK